MQLPHHPVLSLQLTPSFDADGVSGLSVVFRVQNPQIDAGKPMFNFWPFRANVPCHPFQERDIRSTDDEGPLAIRFRDLPSQGRDTQQQWYFGRPTRGDVILEFDVFPRRVDATTPLGGRIDLRRDQGGVHGSGQWFLPLLISDKVFTNVVRWNVPADAPKSTRCVWSFGEGTKPLVRVGRSDTLWNTVYMVGPVQCYPETPSAGEDGSAACYWFGELPANLERLKSYNTALFPKLAAFFGSSGGSYRIIMRKSIVGFGGTGFDGSYVLEYDKATKNETDKSLVSLFTHEMVHSFALISPEADGYENEWFIEGIAEYYSAYLPYRFGLQGMDYLIHSINGHLQAYYTSPRISMDIRDAAEQMFVDWYAEWISYKRGFAYLLFIDLLLRKLNGISDTMATGPLDTIVIELSRRYREGETVRFEQWLESLRESFGNTEFPLEQHFEDMLRGRQNMDFTGLSFNVPCKQLEACRLPIIEYGFDRSSIRTRIVSNVVPESPAAAAGLWDGAHIVSTSRAGLCVEDIRNTYKVVVQDGEDQRLVEFLPRLKKTAPAWQLADS